MVIKKKILKIKNNFPYQSAYDSMLSTIEETVIHKVLAIQGDRLNDSANPLTQF